MFYMCIGVHDSFSILMQLYLAFIPLLLQFQAKSDYANKLETYKQAVQRLSDEIDRLKRAESSLPEVNTIG